MFWRWDRPLIEGEVVSETLSDDQRRGRRVKRSTSWNACRSPSFVDVIISATAELSHYIRVICCRVFFVISVSHLRFAVRSC